MTLCEHGCGTELREVTLGYFLGPIVELYDKSGKHTPERCRDALKARLAQANRDLTELLGSCGQNQPPSLPAEAPKSRDCLLCNSSGCELRPPTFDVDRCGRCGGSGEEPDAEEGP